MLKMTLIRAYKGTWHKSFYVKWIGIWWKIPVFKILNRSFMLNELFLTKDHFFF